MFLALFGVFAMFDTGMLQPATDAVETEGACVDIEVFELTRRMQPPTCLDSGEYRYARTRVVAQRSTFRCQ